MNRFVFAFFAVALLFGGRAVAECPSVRAPFGVAMVPYMRGAGDATEQLLYEIAGVMPGVDRVFVPQTPWELFGRLIQLKKAGREIDLLVIMGHGARDNPSVLFAKGALLPRNVDIPLLQRELRLYEEAVRRKQESGEDSSLPAREVAERRTQLQTLEAVSGVMARNAQVLLLNCSPAATPEGRVFLRNLGSILLAKRGGGLTASRTDIRLNEVMMPLARVFRLVSHWEWVPSGEVTVQGAKFVTESFAATSELRPKVTPSANARGEVEETLRLKLGFNVEGLEAGESLDVCQRVNVRGPEGRELPVKIRTLNGPNPQSADEVAFRPRRPGPFTWNYTVESRHFQPLQASVPFEVVAAKLPANFVKRPLTEEIKRRTKKLVFGLKKAPTTAGTLDERLAIFREYFETMEAHDRRSLLGTTDFQVIEQTVRSQAARAPATLDRMLSQFRLVLF